MVSVNYIGDASNLFTTGFEKKIASILFNNQHATNISNYDDRLLQKAIIANLEKRPEVLIIGSSRTMLINSSFFKQGRVVNNSVTGATIQDLIALYQMYANENILPQKIILGIDPWTFNANNGQMRWKSNEAAYQSFYQAAAVKEGSLNLDKYQQLISLSYFQASLEKLPSSEATSSGPLATNAIYNEGNTKLFDGALTYKKAYREASPSEIVAKAKNYASRSLYSIENFTRLDPDLKKEFEALIEAITKNKIELTLFLTPYHPIVYEQVKIRSPRVLEAEEYIRSYSEAKGLKYYGSFDPDKAGADASDFYDGMHLNEKGVRKMLQLKTEFQLKSIGNW